MNVSNSCFPISLINTIEEKYLKLFDFSKILLLILFTFTFQNSYSSICRSAGEEIIYPDGRLGCIRELNLPDRDSKGFYLSSLINRFGGYVAIPKENRCKAIIYKELPVGVYLEFKNISKNYALNRCESYGCSCFLLIEENVVQADAYAVYKERYAADSQELKTNDIGSVDKKMENEGELKEQVSSAEIKRAKEQRVNVELVLSKQQQDLAAEAQQKEQVRLVQEAKQRDQERQIAEQRIKEEKRLYDEELAKERIRLTQQASEISRLLAEAEESKRKKAELEEQLRLAKEQNQFPQTSGMTAMANRKALVIGNDTYKSVMKLLNAREDAKAMASNLSAVGYKVTLQLDLNEKEMKAALRTFSSQVQGGDEVLFFFAGHGVQLGAVNYLLPTDIGGESEAQVKDEAIQLQRVLDDMNEKKAKFTLVMIDACRDNPFKTAGRNIGGRGLAPTTAATGQMVVFSAGTGQQALDRLGENDKNKNGLFTRTFLKEMQKTGVSIDRIVKNVRNEVAELAKSVGHEQVPAIYDQVLGDFFFKVQR